MEQIFWIAKDSEGNYLPQVYVYRATGSFGQAAKAEWDENLSTKKANKGLNLVKVKFEETI